MYLMINGNRHTVSRRVANPNEVRYLTVTPEPEQVAGKIQMYDNNGFMISEDDADQFLRSTYSGTLLILTNIPEPIPVEPSYVEPEVTTDDMANAIVEGVNEV